MSDGPSDANRALRSIENIGSAAAGLADACDDVYDAAFGLPNEILTEINFALARVGLRVDRK